MKFINIRESFLSVGTGLPISMSGGERGSGDLNPGATVLPT